MHKILLLFLVLASCSLSTRISSQNLKCKVEGKLYFYYRNGARKEEMASRSPDVMEIDSDSVEFVRDEKGSITGFKMRGLFFEKW